MTKIVQLLPSFHPLFHCHFLLPPSLYSFLSFFLSPLSHRCPACIIFSLPYSSLLPFLSSSLLFLPVSFLPIIALPSLFPSIPPSFPSFLLSYSVLSFLHALEKLILNLTRVWFSNTWTKCVHMHTFPFDDPGSFKGFPLCISQCFSVLVISVKITCPFLHLRRLAAETDEALKEQDERLGKILAKLQVSVVSKTTKPQTNQTF